MCQYVAVIAQRDEPCAAGPAGQARNGSREQINYVYTMLENGTSADRQLKVYQETGDLRAVVDSLMKETLEGVF